MLLGPETRKNPLLQGDSTLSQVLAANSDYKHSLLEGLELFHGVCPDDVQELLQRCDRRDLGKGELLLSPGEKNEHVYIVLSGVGRIVRPGDIATRGGWRGRLRCCSAGHGLHEHDDRAQRSAY